MTAPSATTRRPLHPAPFAIDAPPFLTPRSGDRGRTRDGALRHRVRELIELQHLATGQEVIVVPVLVSKGSVSRDKVPNDIRGTRSVYVGEPLAPHPAMARWIEARVQEATRSTSAAR